MEIAAAGGHIILILQVLGKPCQAVTQYLPPMTFEKH
jgi:hypothetical protein